MIPILIKKIFKIFVSPKPDSVEDVVYTVADEVVDIGFVLVFDEDLA